MRKPLTYFSLALFTFGVLGFIFNLLVGSGILSINAELPLYGVQGVVERNNKLYIGLGYYSRVQIYDLDGNYIGFKKTNNYSKDYDFKIDDNGNPEIVVLPNKDKVNKILKNVHISTCLDDSCINYKIERSIPLQMICYGNDNKNVVIQQSFFKTLCSGPINPWLVGVSGIIIFCLANISRIGYIFGQNGHQKNKFKLLLKETLK